MDTFGETSKFYNLTNVSFIGGSFVKHGGQNPLEAVRLGNYIVSGKNVDNFKEIYSYLKQNKISFQTICYFLDTQRRFGLGANHILILISALSVSPVPDFP